MFYGRSSFFLSQDFLRTVTNFMESHDFLRKFVIFFTNVWIFHKKSTKSPDFLFTKSEDVLRKVTIFYGTFCGIGTGERAPRHHLMGKRLSVATRASTPPRFSPQAPLIPSHLTMAEGDAAETQHQQQHDDVAQGSRAIIAPRELWFILSGIPLSLTVQRTMYSMSKPLGVGVRGA